MTNLSGKVAIVTGFTGTLGSVVAAELLAAGATVIAPYRSVERFEQSKSERHISAQARIHGLALDLVNEQAVLEAYQRAAQKHSGIDILVNCAGGFAGGKPVHETAWSLWQEQLDINLRTAVVSAHGAIPQIIARGGGTIINVGSRAATQEAKNLAAYATAKRGLMQLTETLAAELRPYNITVNTVMPSTIDSPGERAARPKADFKTWVPPEDLARIILFLTGPDARYISGAHIPVYGR